MNINKNYFEQLKIKKIIPIINSKNFNDDAKKIESIITNNKDIKLIEITLRESNSYQNAIKLVEYFPKIKSVISFNWTVKGILSDLALSLLQTTVRTGSP